MHKSASSFLFIFFLSVLSNTAGYCQRDYITHHYTNKNGLPANGIKGIELDKKNGFLWIGTQAGLVRFDGKNFNTFGSEKNAVAVSRIYFIAKNREGTIFCEDDNSFVYRVAHNKPQFVTIDSTLVDPFLIRGGNSKLRTPEQIAESLKNHSRSSFLPEWMSFDDDIGDSGSFTFLAMKKQPYHYSAARNKLVELSGAFLQIIKLNGQTYLIDEQLNVSVYSDRLMKLLPVKIKGLPVWDKNGNEKPRIIWKRGMKEPLFIYKQDIWKLRQIDGSLNLQPLCHDCCPADAYIYDAQIWDEQGIIFLASEKNGLYVLRKPSLRTIRTDTLIEAGRAEYAQAEITPGIISTGYGVSFSPSGELAYRKGGLQFQPWAIYRDQCSDHWFHVADTVVHLNHQNGRYTKMPIGSGVVKMIFAETQGRLFVTTDMVIAELTGNKYRELYRLPYQKSVLKNSLNPDAAIEWKPGVLAIATEKLLFFDTRKNAAPDTISIPGVTTKVRTLLKYGDYLFIGTYGQGFYVYKNGIVKKMPLDKYKYLSYTHCFMPDSKGFCWISTNHGLFKVSMNVLIAAYEKNIPEIYYHYFGNDDGIFNTEFNGGCQPCALKLSNGLFSFPNMNGVVVLDPIQPNAIAPPGNIFVENIFADSAVYEPGEKSLAALPYDLKSISFAITVPQFGNPENVYFSYKLDPYNDNWVSQDIVQNNSIQFGGLGPGDYRLYLRVRNGFGSDQFVTRIVNFHILKPWFQQWWFYVICFCCFIALIWFIVKWRTILITRKKEELQQLVDAQTTQLEQQLHLLQNQQGKLEQDNRIKSRLIAIISHDMISPLKFMSFIGKKLGASFASSEPAYQAIGTLVTVAQELESLTQNMLNWIRFHHSSTVIRYEYFDLQRLVKESTEIPATLAEEKGIALRMDFSGNTMIWQYRQALGVIIYNLAINAVKYTQKGVVKISGSIDGQLISLEVADTGVGMPEDMVEILNNPELFITDNSFINTDQKFQFGYRIVKDLLQLTDGSMNVQSAPGIGTRITIQLMQQKEKNATIHDHQ